MALENNLIGCEVRRYNALLTVILHRIPVSTCLRNLRYLRDGDARQKGSWDPRAEEFDQRQIKNGRNEIKRHSDDKN
ncbi:hypothetical protein ERO13_A06G066850v2 [Gossypium hirsutum]|nr:hypothetical protein ERO13_A06G066850v2 [Gossypium hirsutum]